MSYNVMGNDYSNEFGTQDVADNKVVSILAYIPLLFWIPLVAGNTSYCRFHANQGLLLTLAGLALGIVNAIISLVIGWIPIVGAIITGLVSLVCGVAVLGLMIYGMVCTLQGFAKELPFIGGLAQLIRR
ncbi:MAG: hypothetical protein ACI4JD_04975 [Ruminococcus sp.]